jgi:acetoin utilization deacetylase AcuC-like enzyme
LNLVIDNGFHNRDVEIVSSLFYTTGSMLAAAAHAVIYKRITCSPTSGFHHAGYRFGGDFCTFNGLMVTALKLQALGKVKSVGILDCDAHYGNGTADIIEELGLTWVKHHIAGEFFASIEDFGSNGSEYFKWLEMSINDVSTCDLVIYQAGADPHIEDSLGGFLTDQQLMSRDCMVFKGARRAKLPLVWNLAGGYRRDAEGGISPVFHTHRATAKVAIENQFDMY